MFFQICKFHILNIRSANYQILSQVSFFKKQAKTLYNLKFIVDLQQIQDYPNNNESSSGKETL